ncbi:MAG: hypothetical protein RL268_2323, partial [Pseudomonadota bacterium]
MKPDVLKILPGTGRGTAACGGGGLVATADWAEGAKPLHQLRWSPSRCRGGTLPQSRQCCGKTLRFINAPFLHWPDTILTYLVEDRILFPCDFLGAHFSSPEFYNDELPRPEIA